MFGCLVGDSMQLLGFCPAASWMLPLSKLPAAPGLVQARPHC